MDPTRAPAADVWARAASAYPPALAAAFFEIPGDSAATLDAAEARLGVALPPRVRALMRACSGAGLPGRAHRFAAETALLSAAAWRRAPAVVGDELEWSAEKLAEHVVIGFVPEGVDYSNLVLLNVRTGGVFGLVENIPELRALGDMAAWVANLRVDDDGRRVDSGGAAAGCDGAKVDLLSAYFNARGGDQTPAQVAAMHATYLGFGASAELDNSARVARWPRVAPAFISALEEAIAARADAAPKT
jgi:hypothetical protein